MMVVDSEDLRALVAYLSVVLFFTTRPSEDEDFWFLGTKVPADSKPGVAVSPILIHSTLHRYGKALSKPWLCSYSLGKAVPPCSTRRSFGPFLLVAFLFFSLARPSCPTHDPRSPRPRPRLFAGESQNKPARLEFGLLNAVWLGAAHKRRLPGAWAVRARATSWCVGGGYQISWTGTTAT